MISSSPWYNFTVPSRQSALSFSMFSGGVGLLLFLKITTLIEVLSSRSKKIWPLSVTYFLFTVPHALICSPILSFVMSLISV